MEWNFQQTIPLPLLKGKESLFFPLFKSRKNISKSWAYEYWLLKYYLVFKLLEKKHN